MKVLIKDYKEFDEQLKSINENYKTDIQYWVCYGKPAIRKIARNNNEFIELAIYYNYKKDLVSKITKNRIISENDGCMMSSPYLTIKEEFTTVKTASKKNLLEKAKELNNINLEQYF